MYIVVIIILSITVILLSIALKQAQKENANLQVHYDSEKRRSEQYNAMLMDDSYVMMHWAEYVQKGYHKENWPGIMSHSATGKDKDTVLYVPRKMIARKIYEDGKVQKQDD